MKRFGFTDVRFNLITNNNELIMHYFLTGNDYQFVNVGGSSKIMIFFLDLFLEWSWFLTLKYDPKWIVLSNLGFN